jgi:hypothetical protein
MFNIRKNKTLSLQYKKRKFPNSNVLVLWRTINLGRPVIELTSKCEAGIMFN